MHWAPIVAGGWAAMGSVAGVARQTVEAAGSFADVLAQTAQQQAPAAASESAPRVAAQQSLAAQFQSASADASLFQDLTGRPPAYAGEPVRLHDVRDNIDSRLAALGSAIRDRLESAGVDVTQPFQMRIGGDGRLLVEGHPQQAEIEQLLNDDPALADEARRLSATLELLHAAERHAEFADAYADDPVAAVARFAELFDSRQPALRLAWDQFGLRVEE